MAKLAHSSRVVALLLAASLGSTATRGQPAAVTTNATVVARYDYVPHATQSGLGELTLELRDALTQQPIDYTARQLAVWLQRAPKTLADGEVSCSDKVRALASQGIGRRAVVDFNVYSLVSVNTDRTVAFINPFLRLNNAKLEAVVSLPGDATVHLHHAAAREIWVAMRASDAVAVIDTDTRLLKRTIAFAPGSGPQALALSGNSVWVGFAQRANWLRFDSSASAQPDARVEAPAAQRFVSGEGGRQLLGLGRASVSWLDAQSGQPRTLALPAAPTAAAWSALSQRWLVASADARLRLIDPRDPDAPPVLALDSPVTALATFDAGRYAIAAMPGASAAAVIDVATATVLQTVATVPQVGEIGFSETFAYLHSAPGAQASLLLLAEARKGAAKPVSITTGNPAPDVPAAAAAAAAGDPAMVQTMIRAPDGMSMLIANRHDGHIYQYAEGMMAPVGSFSNYRRSANALVLLDHGFESLGVGRYRATMRHTRGGPHELVLSGVQPRFAECQALALPEVADRHRELLAARPNARLVQVESALDGRTIAVEVSLEDPTSAAPMAAVTDLMLLAFDKRSGWQRRVLLVESSPGRYSASLPLPATGARLDLLVSSATQDLPFGAGLIGTHEVRGVSGVRKVLEVRRP